MWLLYLRAQGYADVIEPHGKRSESYYVPQDSVLPEAVHSTAWTGRTAAEVIRHNKSRPFFLFCSFIKPHPPFDPCVPYNKMYDPSDVPLPHISEYDSEPYDSEVTAQNGYKVNDIQNVTEEELRKKRAYYYGCVSQVDTAVGEVLKALKDSGQYENTMVIFTSDHGEMLGDHLAYGKRTYFEQSCHIPLIISYPSGIPGGKSSDALGILPDIYATVLTTVNAKIPPECTGGDLMKICTGDEKKVREYTVAQYGTGRRFKTMLRWENYKYIYIANGRRRILYNLSSDPYELNPISDSPLFASADRKIREYFMAHGFTEAFDGGQLIGYDYIKPVGGTYINQYPRWQERTD